MTVKNDFSVRKMNMQADEIMKKAEALGLEKNYFFITTFQRYRVQLGILKELEKQMKKDGMLTTKEYVKGRGNLYVNPAVKEYNNTASAANKTVETLMRIINTLDTGENDEKESDPLLAALFGSSTEDAAVFSDGKKEREEN